MVFFKQLNLFFLKTDVPVHDVQDEHKGAASAAPVRARGAKGRNVASVQIAEIWVGDQMGKCFRI